MKKNNINVNDKKYLLQILKK